VKPSHLSQQILKRIGFRRIIVASITFVSCLVLQALPHDTPAAAHPDGKLIWKFEVGNRAYLAAANGVIYAASPTGCSDYVPCGPPARLFALDDRTGKQKWMIENIGDDSAPVISDGLV
jgi:outer membrane protein assembly factor BamB